MALARAIARLAAWIFYRIERAGAPPAVGPVLLLPNHPNALLDPAVVWATAGRDVRFVAKSTLFRVPVLGALLRAARAIPVHRHQDPGADPAQNVEMFAETARALAAGDAVCLFPEGVSRAAGRLETLRTGAARIALATAASGVDVRLVPVGLYFERQAIFRSRAVVVYGEPFRVDAALAARGPADPEAVRALTAAIAERLRALVVEVDPRTDAELVERVDRLYCAARPAARQMPRVDRRRLIAAGLERLRREDPAWYAAIRRRLDAYDARLRRFGLRDRDLEGPAPAPAALRFAARELPLALLLLPVAAAGVVLYYAPYTLAGRLAAPWRDLETQATAKVVAGAASFGAWTLALAAVVWRLAGLLPAIAALVALPPLAAASLFAIERETAVWRVVSAYLTLHRITPRARAHLARRRSEIAGVLDQVYEWLVERAPEGRPSGDAPRKAV
jgi:1-acyl-sn-glycerol-3-phosphate acyltransferase